MEKTKIRLVSRSFDAGIGGIGKYAGDVFDVLSKSRKFDVDVCELKYNPKVYVFAPSLMKIPRDDRINIGFNVFEDSMKSIDIAIVHDLIPLTHYYLDGVSGLKRLERMIVSRAFYKAVRKIIKSQMEGRKYLIFDSSLTEMSYGLLLLGEILEKVVDSVDAGETAEELEREIENMALDSSIIHPFVYRRVPKHEFSGIKTIGMLGRNDSYKGYGLFEKIVESSRNLRGLVAGPGHKKRKVGRVEYLGFVDDLEKDFWSRIDALVFTSKIEGFGLPIIEAFSRKIPVYIRPEADIDDELARFCHLISERDMTLEEADERKVADALEFAKSHTRERLEKGFENAVRGFLKLKENEKRKV